ncbi:MAG: hypothetical protein ACOX52_16310 [Verrucomicrobiota bacterium]
MDPTHPDRLVENVTAPSAGGFPGPDGKALPFRIRMGRYPAEIAEAQRCIGRGGGKGTYIGAVFNNCLGPLNRYH